VGDDTYEAKYHEVLRKGYTVEATTYMTVTVKKKATTGSKAAPVPAKKLAPRKKAATD
jgi:hypothetical protein